LILMIWTFFHRIEDFPLTRRAFPLEIWLTSLTLIDIARYKSLIEQSCSCTIRYFDRPIKTFLSNIQTIKWVLMMWLTRCQLITHALIYMPLKSVFEAPNPCACILRCQSKLATSIRSPAETPS
jgi:hypothetical protein